MTALARVCGALRAAGVRYAVVGGHAVALHGAVRGTVHIDIVLDWTRSALNKAERALQSIGLESRLPVSANEICRFRDEYVKNRNLTAWNFYNPRDLSQQVDIIITYDLRNKRIRRIDLADGTVHILAIDDLIAMKTASGRPQDREDVAALEKLQ